MAVSSINTTLFARPRCIVAWQKEANRVTHKTNSKFKTEPIIRALELLNELYCLKNPLQKNPLQVRQTVFEMFLQASMCGQPLAMFFEGLARKEGFGCAVDRVTGQALIQVAGARKCAEALNYLALCYLKQNVITALTLFKEAAFDGHVLAHANFMQLREHLRIMLRRRRKIVELATHEPRLRLTL